MTVNNQNVAARLTEAYKGIEGFYILNSSGGLGHFSADGQRLLKETFSDSLSGFDTSKIQTFFSALGDASNSFPPVEEKELGYLLPLDDNTVWNTATLKLHEFVVEELKSGFERDMDEGRMTLDEGDRRYRDLTPERSVHRGFEALLAHIGSFGTHVYFPVLYYRPAPDGQPNETGGPMRVINLLSLLSDSTQFSIILATMRRNLTERGALNTSSRLEHRFKLVDED